MEVLSQIFYFIIIIGVLVFVHELGHFLAAKLFRMRVERFSIGFPPRAFGKQIGETDYCVSWLPIGGYVKISGMIDESLDTEHLNKAPEPWEFRAKPIWQRIIVITAGVIMNIFLAIAIFWGLNLSRGLEYHQVTTIGHVEPASLAEKAGLTPGDHIVAVNNVAVKYWEDIEKTILLKYLVEDLEIAVERNGQREELTLAQNTLHALSKERFGIIPAGSSALIDRVEPDQPAAMAGLDAGDVIVQLDTIPIRTHVDVIEYISTRAGSILTVTWERNGKRMSNTVIPNEAGRIGIAIRTNVDAPVVREEYNVAEAFVAGTRDFVTFTVLSVTNIWQIIIGETSFKHSIGGPVKIAEMAAAQAEVGISSFLGLMALLSISLAIINILPFPALDGGHLMFLIYEGIFRREVPNKVRLVMQQAGMVLLFALMAFVIYNDIVN